MQLLATLRATDVETNPPDFDYTLFKPRLAGRAIVFDAQGHVALIHVQLHNYYILPGGGIEDEDEDVAVGLQREIREELGCEIDITGEVGSTELYMDRWHQKQTDYCYAARVVSSSNDTFPTDFETTEGHTIVWAQDLAEALQLVEHAQPPNRDGKLVRARDLLFLSTLAKGVGNKGSEPS